MVCAPRAWMSTDYNLIAGIVAQGPAILCYNRAGAKSTIGYYYSCSLNYPPLAPPHAGGNQCIVPPRVRGGQGG